MKKIIKKIKQSKKVAIFGHQSPDGDCLGSMYAISFLCKKLGKVADIFVDDEISFPYTFLTLPNFNCCEFDAKNYDLLISTDVAAKHLLGKYGEIFENFDNTIAIDHHTSRDLVGKITFVKQTASCAEIVFDILKKSKVKFDSDVSTFLYLGVSDDTGCFKHDNTTSSTHKIAGELIDMGADFKKINYNVFKLKSLKSFEMTNKLNQQIVIDNGLTYNVVTYDFMQKNGYTTHDIGDYVNTLINLEGTKIAFLIVEKQKNAYRINFRSIKGYNVSKVAQKFNGGGHIQASGGSFSGDFKKNLAKLIQECKLAIDDGDCGNV